MTPGSQLDAYPSGRHRWAAEAGEVLCEDIQRNLALHPQYLRSLRLLPVPLLPILQFGSAADSVVDTARHDVPYSLRFCERTDANADLLDEWCSTRTPGNLMHLAT